jgi:hypothetical protein
VAVVNAHHTAAWGRRGKIDVEVVIYRFVVMW